MIIERNGKKWHWPDSDKKLIQVFDWVDDIKTIMKYVPEDRRDICIQAGGAMGQWPIEFAKYFSKVITFEANYENYECLEQNIKGWGLINAYYAALSNSDAPNFVGIYLDECENGNSGAYYIGEGTKIPTLAIDDGEFNACDLIQLDVEGYEYNALKGGERTILKYKPVIVIEEKPLPHMQPNEHLKARALLESWGYQEVEKIHRDVIFVC